MKKLMRVLGSSLISLCMAFVCLVPVNASNDLDSLVANLIYYYKEGDCQTDISRTLDSIKSISEEDYNQWLSIINYWNYIDNDMVENIDVAPDGLPNTSEHAFVVLGYALNSDGSMQDELKGRCQVAYDSAMKYPNAYVVVAGGGTAKDNPNVTEAGQMRDYLVNELGLDANRIIVEDQSKTTVQNAQNTFTILYNNYNISTISMITSQYHLKRGTLLYYTESLIMARTLNKTPIKLIGNAGWLRSDKTSEGVNMEASSLAQLAGVSMPGSGRPGETASPVPDKSILQSIAFQGTTTYNQGDNLDLRVIATYDIDSYQRDITSLVTINGYDETKVGIQTLTVSYSENDVSKDTTIEIEVKAKLTSLTPIETNSVKTGDNSSMVGYGILFVTTLLGGAYLSLKK